MSLAENTQAKQMKKMKLCFAFKTTKSLSHAMMAFYDEEKIKVYHGTKGIMLDFSQDFSHDEVQARRPVQLMYLGLEAHDYVLSPHAGVVGRFADCLHTAVDQAYQLLRHGLV